MLKTLSAKTCAFDCEWIPCADTARRLLDLAPDTTEADAFDAVWEYSRKEGDDTPRPFIKLVLSKVLTLAAVFRRYDAARDETELQLIGRGVGVDYDHEVKLIETFLEGVAKRDCQLWGFNSRGSDLPILLQRGVALGAVCPKFTKRNYLHRYRDDHVDIKEALLGWSGSAAPSLNELAAACGVPGKLDASGDEVAEFYLQGRLEDIVAYNECDALTTHLLMLHVARFAGQLDSDDYGREVQAVEDLLDREIANGKAHLATFRERWAAWRRDGVALVF